MNNIMKFSYFPRIDRFLKKAPKQYEENILKSGLPEEIKLERLSILYANIFKEKLGHYWDSGECTKKDLIQQWTSKGYYRDSIFENLEEAESIFEKIVNKKFLYSRELILGMDSERKDFFVARGEFRYASEGQIYDFGKDMIKYFILTKKYGEEYGFKNETAYNQIYEYIK